MRYMSANSSFVTCQPKTVSKSLYFRLFFSRFTRLVQISLIIYCLLLTFCLSTRFGIVCDGRWTCKIAAHIENGKAATKCADKALSTDPENCAAPTTTTTENWSQHFCQILATFRNSWRRSSTHCTDNYETLIVLMKMHKTKYIWKLNKMELVARKRCKMKTLCNDY